MYWHWHSIHNACETYWKGILSHDLQENAIYREVSQIGKSFEKYIGLIARTPDFWASLPSVPVKRKNGVEYEEKAFGFGKLQTVSGV